MYEVVKSFIYTVLLIIILVGGYLLVKTFPIIGIIGICLFIFCVVWFLTFVIVSD